MLSKLIVAETKAKKICGVCGDKAKSYHFGGVSCDSCKAFFRRSVQNNAFKLFQCSFSGTCDITMVNRKCCQFCRFRKCLQIGMETSWVMTEEERMNMLQTRHWKRGKRTKSKPSFEEKERDDEEVSSEGATTIRSTSRRKKLRLTVADEKSYLEDDFVDELAAEEWAQIEMLLMAFQPYLNSKHKLSSTLLKSSSKWLYIVIFIVSIQRLVRFASSVDCFSKVSIQDQMTLLRTNVFEMFLVVHFSGYAAFDSIDNGIDCKATSTDEGRSRCPFLDASCVAKTVDAPPNDDDDTAVRLLFRSAVNDDKVTLVLLLLVVLFNTDSNELVEMSLIESYQIHFCNLLGKYLKCKLPNKQFFLPKLLMLLPVLREMRDKHVSFYFNLSDETNEINNLIESGVF